MRVGLPQGRRTPGAARPPGPPCAGMPAWQGVVPACDGLGSRDGLGSLQGAGSPGRSGHAGRRRQGSDADAVPGGCPAPGPGPQHHWQGQRSFWSMNKEKGICGSRGDAGALRQQQLPICHRGSGCWSVARSHRAAASLRLADRIADRGRLMMGSEVVQLSLPRRSSHSESHSRASAGLQYRDCRQ